MVPIEILYLSHFSWFLVAYFMFVVNNKKLNRIHELEMELLNQTIKKEYNKVFKRFRD